MTERPFKLTIAALGGQGGGVLTQWLVDLAKAEDYLAQSTSVPGVAQRTGATVYYLEFFPRAAAERAGREPVMALMPVPGDVDCVIASELAEAGRAIQRGLVTRERTTLIASTHRSYAIAEKSALGSGIADSDALAKLARNSAKRLLLFDMEATAERNGSVISAVLLGALCGSGVLPFRKGAFEQVIRSSGLAVEANLRAFEEANQLAQRADGSFTAAAKGAPLPPVPATARTPALQGLLERIHRLPPAVQAVVLEGARRAIDFQDGRYAALYLDRLEKVAALEQAGSVALLEASARGLALWMSFEDTIRVADLKTRGSRFTRVREEVRAPPGQLLGITEFMKPRVEELAGTMPVAVGRWMLASQRLRRLLSGATSGRQIRTSTVSGFLLLYGLSGLRRWRRGTLRYYEENARIVAWLACIGSTAAVNYPLAVELARAQRLVKGYGETYEHGWRSFQLLLQQVPVLEPRSDGGAQLALLAEAALADEEGLALRGALLALHAAAPARQVATA
ncbi:MAG TPA: indolepyruvate oxidoreductase subunit beta family protein [Steroidobacteraceae bacterium]|jgi:indolepyruvate ferredoxin oxidoreductase beta subunit